MRDEAAEDDAQFRRRKSRTRWIAAFFEGGAAAVFAAILLSEGNLGGIASGIAFGAVALVAFLLWPMTLEQRGFPLWRLAIFGVLVFIFGLYLWLLVVQLLIPTPSEVPHLQHL